MNIYLIGIILFSILILLGGLVNGYHKGLAREASVLISMLAAIFVILMLAGLIEGLRSKDAPGILIGMIMLVLFGVIYKIVHILLTSIKIVSRLPVIRGLDNILGAAFGFTEGFLILYVLEYVLRTYIL